MLSRHMSLCPAADQMAVQQNGGKDVLLGLAEGWGGGAVQPPPLESCPGSTSLASLDYERTALSGRAY